MVRFYESFKVTNHKLCRMLRLQSGTVVPIYPAGSRPSVGPVGMVNFWGRLAESIIGVA